MAFTLPQFNLPLLVWRSGSSPFVDPPDVEDLTCQLFIRSRMSLDITGGDDSSYSPPIILRIPLGFQPLPGDVYGVNGNAITYYKLRWSHIIHWEFPNAYWHVIVEMCNDRGATPINTQIT